MSDPNFRPRPTNTGLNILDFGDLTPVERAIMRTVLRYVRIRYAELVNEVKTQLAASPPTQGEIDEALARMVLATWIHRHDQAGDVIYTPNLQVRPGFSSMDLTLPRRSTSSVFSMWEALRALEGQEAPPEATPAPQPKSRLGIGGRSWIILLLVLLVSIANRFVLSTLEIVSTSGFIGQLGTPDFLWLNIVEMLISMLVSGAYLSLIDRLPRVRMLKLLLGTLAGVYLLFAGAFFFFGAAKSLASEMLFALIYLLRTQQILIFTVAFWNVANELYSMAQARRIFPLLVTGETIGSLAGYGLFSLPQLMGFAKLFSNADAGRLLLFSSGLLIVVLALVHAFLKEPRREMPNVPKHASLRESLREGTQVIRDVKLFRYLALLAAVVWMALAAINYHFYVVLERTGDFEVNYSRFNIISTIALLLLQFQLTRYLMRKVPVKDAFLGLPGMLLLGLLPALILRDLATGVVLYFIGNAVYYAWDAPSFSSLQSLIPEERRGLIATLINNYAYALGMIAGNVAVGLLVWSPFLFGARLSDGQITGGYLLFALAGVIAALGLAYMVHRTYDESMLSWRLSRRSRAANVLDKLDF